jgi:hypothetical protein
VQLSYLLAWFYAVTLNFTCFVPFLATVNAAAAASYLLPSARCANSATAEPSPPHREAEEGMIIQKTHPVSSDLANFKQAIKTAQTAVA